MRGGDMVLKCPSCSQTFSVGDDVTSGKVKCPQCGQRLDLGRILRPGDLRPGTMLGGCRIEGLLGRGGMAVVYKATQLSLDRAVALKVLPTHFASSPQFVERFNREASALALLAHPNIVGILYNGAQDDTYFFVMEYVEGKSLRDRLLREDKLSPQEVRRILQGICRGLAYAHENGVIHRDIKPGNVLLDAAGTPKLADFGIARMTGGDTQEALHLTHAHSTMGSADYIAPEQRADAANVDHRADIYSLGVMLYQMLTGQLPVGSFKAAAQLVPGLPTAVDRAIRTALATSPDDRYDSVAKFLFALNHAFDDTALRHAPRAAAPPPRRSKPPAAAILLAAGAIIVAGAVVAIALSRRGAGPPATVPPPVTNSHKAPPPRRSTPPATHHAVRPKPPEPKTEKAPPPPEEEPPAVRQAMADVRQFIAARPDEFPTQVQRLRELMDSHPNGQVRAAASKEMDIVVGSLDKAITDHFDAARKRADALMDQRAYAAAIRLVGILPPNIFTHKAKKKADALADQYRAKCWICFQNDCKTAASLAEAGKFTEAIALLSSDYPSAELQRMATAELGKLRAGLAAQEEKKVKEQAKLRSDLAAQLRGLWAERRYPEAAAAAKAAAAKATKEEARAALEPHLRAAALLNALWSAILDACTARKGAAVTISNVKYTVKDVEGETLVLGLPIGEVKRELRKLDSDDLYILARDWLDLSKNADDNLMLGLFLTYESKPDPAGAARAFEKAIALGAPPKLVAAFRDLNGR